MIYKKIILTLLLINNAKSYCMEIPNSKAEEKISNNTQSQFIETDDGYPEDCCNSKKNGCCCDHKICFKKSQKTFSRLIRNIKEFFSACRSNCLGAVDGFCD